MSFKAGDKVYVKSPTSEFYGIVDESSDDEGAIVRIRVDFSRKTWHVALGEPLDERHVIGHHNLRPVLATYVMLESKIPLKQQLQTLWGPLL